ncbi:haloalkane dehalogenase [Oscillatoria salina]|uniref:haloalkane dehalogenase n=1 Tax=Oscillatoria salina TaxID=331517 RepID=UPI0013BCBDC2|nr:haloalkane dehalogenase [Oscillatoria salina]MBZ8182531.1 haloalkane dehalogenase [Oscillatoria salina IIICB1]NET91153.1 haloalkane dehalogenase [Kamptonema sp. SIO1D9]
MRQKIYLATLVSILLCLCLFGLPSSTALGMGITQPAEFPYESKYVKVFGSKMHYIDVGEGSPILFIHGNPTWAYVWRNIIPFVTSHHRAIAVDLIGMGKSDKPDIDYTFADHSRYLEAFIAKLNLKNITFVGYDWGSTLSFYYGMRHEDNVKGLVFMEAMVPPRFPFDKIEKMGKVAEDFSKLRAPQQGAQLVYEENIFIEKLLQSNTIRELSEAELDAYRQPFLKKKDRKPMLVWANQIPIGGEPAETDRIIRSYSEWLTKTKIPKLHLYGKPGAVNPPEVAEWTAAHFPNTETYYVGKGLHCLQEDRPQEIGIAIANWLRGLGTGDW